jgi:hypothetical protein
LVSLKQTLLALSCAILLSGNSARASTNLLSGCLAYQGLLKSYGAASYWPLNEASGTTAIDVIGTNTGTYVNSPTLKQVGFSKVRNMSVAFSNSTSTDVTTTTSFNDPNNLSVMTWFKTTTAAGGALVQFNNSQTGSPTNYDRHLYMQNNGYLVWGVYPNAVKTVTSAAVLNDGNWHMAIGTIGSSGQTLYIDNTTPITVTTVTSAQNFVGWWRIAGNKIAGTSWPNPPTNNYFTGNLASVVIFNSQITTAQANELYKVGLNCGP